MTSNRPAAKSPPPPPRLYRVMGTIFGPLEKALGISCRDFSRLASDKLDEPLTTGNRWRYLFHRLLCDICRRQESRMQQANALAAETLRRASSNAEVQLNAEARDRIREQVARQIQRQ